MLSKFSIIISYSSHLYTAVLNIAIIPLYARYLGIEAYGLIGFSLALQGIALVFDLGLAQTLMRENARSLAEYSLKNSAICILHIGEWLFLFFSALVIGLYLISNNWLANAWLQANEIPDPIVSTCIFFIAVGACLRWFINFYRCGLFGCGDHIWVHTTNIFVSTIKNIGIIPFLVFLDYGLIEFFLYQTIINILETFLYRFRLYKRHDMNFSRTLPNFRMLRDYKKILGPVFFVSSVWIAMTQLDKLLLSHWLDLKTFGYFSLAISIAGIVLLLSLPLNQLLQPQLATLAEAGKRKEMLDLYRFSSQILTAGYLAIASLLAFFAKPILLYWTGDITIATESSHILPWYVLGNVVAALLTLPYMLQFAIGDLKMHMIGNALFAICWLPAIFWVTRHYGGVGAGMVWLSGNVLFLLVWTNLVYHRLFKELFFIWLFKDILAIAVPIILAAYLLSKLSLENNLYTLIFTLSTASLILGFCGMLLGQHSRDYFARLIRQ